MIVVEVTCGIAVLGVKGRPVGLGAPWRVWVMCLLYTSVSGRGHDLTVITATFIAVKMLLCMLSCTAGLAVIKWVYIFGSDKF